MKKLVSLVAALALCFTLGVTVMASTDSPSATEPSTPIGDGSGSNDNDPNANKPNNGNGNGSNNGGNGNGSSTSPKTSDSLIIPGLATVAVAGTVVAGVSKKKMNSDK